MSKRSELGEFDPEKLLKVVARPTRPNFTGGSGPLPTREKRDHDAEEDASMMSGLERIIAKAQQEEEGAPCGLDVGQLAVCTEWVESCCKLRSAKCCPRWQQRELRKLRQALRAESAQRGVPERVLVKAWDTTPAQTPALAKVQHFLYSERSILVLSGTNQCGKTTAAGWAACAHPQLGGRDRVTRYFTAAEATSPQRGDDVLRILQRCALAVLDDVGQAFFGASGFSLRQLEVFVDAVYRENGKLIICTDIMLKDGTGKLPFFELVGRRITSRIMQAGMCDADLGPAFDAKKRG